MNYEDLVNTDIIFDETLNPGFRSDALRLEILYLNGGIYLDTDMCNVNNLNKLWQRTSADFIIGLSNTNAFEINSAIIFCTPKHPLIKHLIERLRENYANHKDRVAKKNEAMRLVN